MIEFMGSCLLKTFDKIEPQNPFVVLILY